MSGQDTLCEDLPNETPPQTLEYVLAFKCTSICVNMCLSTHSVTRVREKEMIAQSSFINKVNEI